MTSVSTLHRVRTIGESLVDVLGQVFAEGSIPVLVSSSRFGGFARWNGAALEDDGSGRLDIESVYEARAFSPDRELRWWLRHGVPEAVVVSESAHELKDLEEMPIEYVATLDHAYLLWGEAAVSINGWTPTGSRSVGAFAIPRQIPDGHLARIEVREYHGVVEQGNVVVVEERYLRLEDGGVPPADEIEES